MNKNDYNLTDKKISLYSMSGYGTATGTIDSWEIRVELRSLNLKNLEIFSRLAPALYPLENVIRDTIRNTINRGKIFVNIDIVFVETGSKMLSRHLPSWKDIYCTLSKFKNELSIKGKITLQNIIDLKDFWYEKEKLDHISIDREVLKTVTLKTLDDAMKNMIEMKLTEGSILAIDILRYLDNIEKSIKFIAKNALKITHHAETRLKNLLKRQKIEKNFDKSRLEYDIALLIDKSDISEEIDRLNSHAYQFRNTLINKNPVGKELNFITQEMMRELNTISAKSDIMSITKHAISARVELEKIREQVQNIE